LTPPILRTFPVKEISPVIPTKKSVYKFKAKEIKEVVMAIPAEGPSLGLAPAGKWMWISFYSKNLLLKNVDKTYFA